MADPQPKIKAKGSRLRKWLLLSLFVVFLLVYGVAQFLYYFVKNMGGIRRHRAHGPSPAGEADPHGAHPGPRRRRVGDQLKHEEFRPMDGG